MGASEEYCNIKKDNIGLAFDIGNDMLTDLDYELNPKRFTIIQMI